MIDSAHHAAGAGGSPPASREKLIEAAARVYATAGFRGATTRRIAEEAGVNEVTIFRLFGSKAALIDAAIQHQAAVLPSETATLPEVPQQPAAELTAWCQAQLEMLRERRSFIRQEMGELSERPPVEPCASRALNPLAVELKGYIRRLHEEGFVEGESGCRGGRDEELHAAGAMLLAALFGDVMGRDMMPEMYPQPPDRAAALYVGLFLRAIRCVA